jgi:hypothetical protein
MKEPEDVPNLDDDEISCVIVKRRHDGVVDT